MRTELAPKGPNPVQRTKHVLIEMLYPPDFTPTTHIPSLSNRLHMNYACVQSGYCLAPLLSVALPACGSVGTSLWRPAGPSVTLPFSTLLCPLPLAPQQAPPCGAGSTIPCNYPAFSIEPLSMVLHLYIFSQLLFSHKDVIINRLCWCLSPVAC
jgi:hypothetical protein